VDEHWTLEHLPRVGKVKEVLPKVGSILALVPFESHTQSHCTTLVTAPQAWR
jgi:hypothetical protein